MPLQAKLEDAVTGHALSLQERSARLKGYIEKLNFGEAPEFGDCIDWVKFADFVGPLLRE